MKLQNGHIIIPKQIYATVLENETQVNWVFYAERGQLLIAGKSKTFFEKMHATKWASLKDKNINGDKALYVREILIDFDLDDTDRPLSYEIKNSGIIAIDLA
ncbi:MAG: hypothetical protein ACK4GN_02600 [Runella sp.]